MDFWISFWAIVLGLVLVLYAGLTVVVTLGGFVDVKAMFASLKRQHEEAARQQRDEDL